MCSAVPQQAEALSHRMDDIERDMQYIKGSCSLALNIWPRAQNVANYLVGQEQDLRPLKNPSRKPTLRSQWQS